ncbi:MAG: MBL fold metallo-hydrolase [Pirellulaceae bacterium]|nr:MBL fold metallo-hydrolase [Pirellulaceae bacterium]
MTKKAITTDIRGKLILLGTGTSVGVPSIGCGCYVCTSPNPKNNRTRCSVILGLEQGNLLIDTGPDLRQQLLREKIGLVHGVLYTHEHADHIFGMDDLRLFQFYLGHAVPVYCEPNVEQRLRQSFDYAFTDRKQTHRGSIPQISMNTISTAPFEVLGTKVIPIRLYHGPRFKVLGFRIGNIAYCTDTNEIPEQSWPLLEGLDCLILDALRRKPHATHFGLDEAVEVAKKIGAKRTVFTHISHDLEHEQTNRALPDSMELAYDGMQLALR